MIVTSLDRKIASALEGVRSHTEQGAFDSGAYIHKFVISAEEKARDVLRALGKNRAIPSFTRP